jgi:hypothetical protein
MISMPNTALDASVLVLNKLFIAVHIVSVRRAFCLLCKDLAEVVTLEEGQFATYDFASWREVSEFRAKYYREETTVCRSRRSSSIAATFLLATTTSASTAARSSRPQN